MMFTDGQGSAGHIKLWGQEKFPCKLGLMRSALAWRPGTSLPPPKSDDTIYGEIPSSHVFPKIITPHTSIALFPFLIFSLPKNPSQVSPSNSVSIIFPMYALPK